MTTTLSPEVIRIRPQARQEQFLASSADIAIMGGGAFGGKTYALEIEPLRHVDNPGFGAVIFRRTIPEVTREGGLWDEAGNIYPLLGGVPNSSEHSYKFPSGAKITFAHMQYENDKHSWKSAQIPLIEFDQLETFTAGQFFYMLSRNRSTIGVRPYVRASANPEPGWLANFLEWWIDAEGYARPERSGVIRWMVRENDITYWGDSKDELQKLHPESIPKSVTFVLSTIYDNQIGMEKDPGYLANLQALPKIDRERLLGDKVRGGNWKFRTGDGRVFDNILARPITDEEIKQFDNVLHGLDFGFYPDPAHYSRVHFDTARRTLYIYGEVRRWKTANEDLYKVIKEAGYEDADLLIADSAEPKSVFDFRAYGANCRGAEKGKDSVKYRVKWMQGLEAIVIDDSRCPYSYKEFSNYEYEKTKAGDIINAYKDVDNHSVDSVGYACNLIWRQRGQ